MARKDKQASTGAQPVLRVVGSPAEAREQSRANAQAQQAAEVPAARRGEGIFNDNRSGRDRREESAPVNDPRRQNPERRRGKSQAAWWLERDYVESHHFVQRSASSRGMQPDEPPAD